MSASSTTASKPKLKLLDLVVLTRKSFGAHATITLEINGVHLTKQESGVGAVDAVYKTIKEMVPHDNAEFLVSHVENEKQSKGSDGVAHVRADFMVGGTEIVGEGSDVDTLVATALAMLDALSQIACFDQGTSH
ncbi:MAG: 2-isopropylmalate synthase [Candidatus Kaiserbacteria bacterium]|nr:2-isopropylmalate synthase [Candidatus Kaiserbacteria bacterium]